MILLPLSFILYLSFILLSHSYYLSSSFLSHSFSSLIHTTSLLHFPSLIPSPLYFTAGNNSSMNSTGNSSRDPQRDPPGVLHASEQAIQRMFRPQQQQQQQQQLYDTSTLNINRTLSSSYPTPVQSMKSNPKYSESPTYNPGYQANTNNNSNNSNNNNNMNINSGSKVTFPTDSLFTPREKVIPHSYLSSSDPLDVSGSMNMSSSGLPTNLLNRSDSCSSPFIVADTIFYFHCRSFRLISRSD